MDENTQQPTETTPDINELIAAAIEENNKTLDERFNTLKEENKQLKDDKRKYEVIQELSENNLSSKCLDLLNMSDDPEVTTSKITLLNELLQEERLKGRDERISMNRYEPPNQYKGLGNSPTAFERAVKG